MANVGIGQAFHTCYGRLEMKLQRAGVLVFCAVLHASAVADVLKDGSDVNSSKGQEDVEQLKQDIKTAKTKNQAIESRNRELSSRMKELEARVLELKRSMDQEEEKPTSR
jgi:septal ring factor EnvC (AmiA/AmiB activator)